jgi:methyl-accepting chemotaxis protein
MKQKISIKMIFQILPVVLVVLAALTLIAVVKTTDSQKASAYDQTSEITRDYANKFDTLLSQKMTIARTLAYTMENYSSKDRQEVSSILNNLIDRYQEIVGVYVGYEPNAFDQFDSAFSKVPGSDVTGRFVPYWNRLAGKVAVEPLTDIDTSDYYTLPKKTKSDSVIEPYLYQGVLMASFVSPILSDNNFIGIAGVDVSLNDLDTQVKQIKVLDTGYAFLVSHTGIFISSPDKGLIGTKSLSVFAQEKNNAALSQIAEAVQNGKEGYVQTTDPFTGKQVVMFYTPITTGNWGLVTVAPTSEMLKGVNQMSTMLILAGLVGLLLTTVIIIWIANNFSRPIISLSKAAEKIAGGDLDVSVTHSGKDELGQMAFAFQRMVVYLKEIAGAAQNVSLGNLAIQVKPQSEQDVLGNAVAQMTNNLRDLVSQVAENAASLGAASGQLASAAEQAGQATNQIAATVQQVAKGTAQQSESVTHTASSVEQMAQAIDGVAKGAREQAAAVTSASGVTSQLSTMIQEISGTAQAQAKGAAEAVNITRDSSLTVEKTVQGMQRIQAKVNQTSQTVQEMGQRSDQIGMIVETIDDIASQTNLLALNAAIEAARAGEHGKGFAVVADEVRKLAEKSAGATKEIAGLVKSIQDTVSDAVQAMKESASEVENGVTLANQSGQALGSILDSVVDGQKSGETIAAAAARMSALATELVTAMDGVSAVVEENTAATEEMSAGSSEVTKSIENIASVSEENSAAIEEVSASTEEMSAQVEEVTASAQSLAEMAQALQQVIGQFKLEDHGQENKQAAAPAAGKNGNGHFKQELVKIGVKA